MSSIVSRVARQTALVGALCAGFATVAQASTYTEVGDAAQTAAGAQKTTGAAGALTDIFGTIASSQDADLFVINITNVATFSATTVNAISANLDTQLFLFKLDGTAVYTNDDDAKGQSFDSTLPAGSSLGPQTAGQYILGISISGYNPTNGPMPNQILFAGYPGGDTTATRGPASGLNPTTLGGFYDGASDAESGAYDIQLTGASVATVTAVPEPSSAALLLLGAGALACASKRRRRDARIG